MPNESRIIALLKLNSISEAELQQQLVGENILQKRSPATAIREYKLINKRFNLVGHELIEIIADGTRVAMIQALLVAAIKHNSLIGEFLRRVLKEKWRVFETKVKSSDWENFLRECEQIDPGVSKWTTSTRAKLGQVTKKCLVEAGYLESATKPIITPVLLLPEIRNYLTEKKEDYILDCMTLQS